MSKKRPTDFPEWASDLVQNEINKEYNKYKPPLAKKKSGWEVGEVPPRQWVNYQADLTNLWIEYLDSQKHKVSSYKNKKDLPRAKLSKSLMAYIEDTDTLAFSNGSKWKKLITEEL
jgi:hypothetical protein